MTKLAPDASPGTKAVLRLGAPPGPKPAPIPAIELDVDVVRNQHGQETVLTLLAEHEAIEKEVYESRADAFRVVKAGDDSFAPPIDLVRYPVHDGDSWEWEGKLVYAGISRSARATVKLSRDGDVRSDVAMEIENADGGPLKRRFSFGFREGKGVVWRTFGNVSARKPVGEAWPP